MLMRPSGAALTFPSVESGGVYGPRKLLVLAFDCLACHGLRRVVLHCVCALIDGNSCLRLLRTHGASRARNWDDGNGADRIARDHSHAEIASNSAGVVALSIFTMIAIRSASRAASSSGLVRINAASSSSVMPRRSASACRR